MSNQSITRKIEFDSGHRIPDHESLCKNIHGHRYTLEATVTGPIQNTAGKADHGMIIDFSVLKSIMLEEVGDVWDHSFLVYKDDDLMIEALKCFPDEHRTVVLSFVPTAENLANQAFGLISRRIQELNSKFKLVHVRLYETPNCFSDVFHEEY